MMIASARFLNRLWRDEGGASAVEYALFLAIVGAALGAAAAPYSDHLLNLNPLLNVNP